MFAVHKIKGYQHKTVSIEKFSDEICELIYEITCLCTKSKIFICNQIETDHLYIEINEGKKNHN